MPASIVPNRNAPFYRSFVFPYIYLHLYFQFPQLQIKLQAPVKLQFITKEKQNREVGNIVCPLKNNCIFSKIKRKPSDIGNKEALLYRLQLNG